MERFRQWNGSTLALETCPLTLSSWSLTEKTAWNPACPVTVLSSWTRGCWSFREAYSASVLLSGSACQASCDNPDYPRLRPVLLEGKGGKRKCIEEESRSPITVLQLAMDVPHGLPDWSSPHAQIHHTRWSPGSRRLLVLAKQLDNRPRWLSCRRARSAFYDCEKASIEPG